MIMKIPHQYIQNIATGEILTAGYTDLSSQVKDGYELKIGDPAKDAILERPPLTPQEKGKLINELYLQLPKAHRKALKNMASDVFTALNAGDLENAIDYVNEAVKPKDFDSVKEPILQILMS